MNTEQTGYIISVLEIVGSVTLIFKPWVQANPY